LLSHELKTPIALLSNSIRTFKAAVDSDPKDFKSSFAKIYPTIQGNIDRLDTTCGSIFKLREVENSVSTLNQKLDLEHFFSQLFEIYELRADEKGIIFDYDFDLIDSVLYGGGVQFEQVVTTLIDNAIKYTQKGSVYAKITLSESEMRCVVTDTGPGIPKDKQELVFKPYKRLKETNSESGLGLGLYMAQKITEQLNGEIQVESNPKEKGSKFTVIFPVFEKR